MEGAYEGKKDGKNENVGYSNEDLKKCLEERKRGGEESFDSAMAKCKSILEAFDQSSSFRNRKPLTPLRLRSGSLTDV